MEQQKRCLLLMLLFLLTCSTGSNTEDQNYWSPSIPKTWDEAALATFELPLPVAEASAKYISSDYYYAMPVRPVYKTYPVYRPDHEPADYMQWLQQQEPQIVFDPQRLKTEQDWIRAGELIFDAPIEFVDSTEVLYSQLREKNWYEKNQVPTTGDGIFPNMSYVIREKGKVEVGLSSCGMCHTRVMPDGTTIKGAQGNFPDDRTFGYERRIALEQSKEKAKELENLRKELRRRYSVPWIMEDVNARPDQMSFEEIISVLEAIPPGACARQGSSIFYPAHIPDLIGIKDQRYFDATGKVRHRSIGDLMRYAALNQGADLLSSYGSYRPRGELPDPASESRYSDEQLYALALFLYSLEPPKNPNPWNALAERGRIVFTKTGCDVCHTPPLYTNNQLIPVVEFDMPADHPAKDDVLNMPVDTDATSTLKTRRGSGYYKVPSLKGLWYRGPFEHNGSVATLEDWFDPNRVKDDYVPTAFLGFGIKTRPVKGHTFGLALSPEDRKALIAFLKTL